MEDMNKREEIQGLCKGNIRLKARGHTRKLIRVPEVRVIFK